MLLQILAKKSRIKQQGPSRELFEKEGRLKGENLTPNSYIYTINCENSKKCNSILKEIRKNIANKLQVVENNELKKSKLEYIHYVIEIGKNKFHDDLEIMKSDKVIQLRSSSREGIYDMGVNKERIEKIIELF